MSLDPRCDDAGGFFGPELSRAICDHYAKWIPADPVPPAPWYAPYGTPATVVAVLLLVALLAILLRLRVLFAQDAEDSR